MERAIQARRKLRVQSMRDLKLFLEIRATRGRGCVCTCSWCVLLCSRGQHSNYPPTKTKFRKKNRRQRSKNLSLTRLVTVVLYPRFSVRTPVQIFLSFSWALDVETQFTGPKQSTFQMFIKKNLNSPCEVVDQ